MRKAHTLPPTHPLENRFWRKIKGIGSGRRGVGSGEGGVVCLTAIYRYTCKTMPKPAPTFPQAFHLQRERRRERESFPCPRSHLIRWVNQPPGLTEPGLAGRNFDLTCGGLLPQKG